MKNACVVLGKNLKIAFEKCVQDVVDFLSQRGYFMREMRTLSIGDADVCKAAIQELKNDFDNVFILVEKAFLNSVKSYMLPSFDEKTLKNSYSNACICEEEGKLAFLLSADDSDTGIGYLQQVGLTFLQERYGRLEKSTLRTMGAAEYTVDELMVEAERLCRGKMHLSRFRKYDEDVIELVYDNNTPKMLSDDVLRMFIEQLGDTVYALEPTSLEEQLVALLKLRGKKLSVAESFTGGGIARRIVSVSGASKVYFEGLNTYDEQSKIKRLGISEFSLRTKGAASDQVAYEMALGLLNTGDCDISIATTGVAGPNSDYSGAPVGLVYIAVGTKERIIVYRYKLDGTRTEITEKAINYALFLACKRLKNI